MSIEIKKLHLVQHILLLENEKVLDELTTFMHNTLPKSDSELHASIAAGLLDIEKGRTYAHEDVQEYIRKKYGL